MGGGRTEGVRAVQQLTVGDGLMVEVVSAGRDCPAVLHTLQLCVRGEGEEKFPVTGHHGKAADAVGVWGGSDSPRHRYKGVAAMEKVTLPGQHTDSLLSVEGVELTGLLLSTSLPTRFNIPLTLFNDRTSSQATRRVLGIAGTDGRDQRGKCWRN